MRFSALDGATVAVWGRGRETRSFLRHAAERLPGLRVAVIVDDAAGERAAGPAPDGGAPRGAAAHDAAGPARDVAALEPAADAGVPTPDAAAPVVAAADAVAAVTAAGCTVLVRSPGVSVHRPQLRALARAGVPSVTATGLWLGERGGRRVLGVTGSKGKTTTATFAHHLIAAAGHPVHLAGNIGAPALDRLDVSADEWVVCELSSYQIADLATGTEIALGTNLYREHTDWHGSEAQYRADKLRLFALPGTRVGVAPVTVAQLADAARATADPVLYATPDGWHVRPDGIARGTALRIPAAALRLRGAHNLTNLCGALAAVEAAGLLPADLPAAVADLPMPRHRLQTVHRADGVEWVDDSISTLPESAIAAVRSVTGGEDVVLIGGGLDRGQDYAELAAVLAAGPGPPVGVAVVGLPDTGTRLVAAAIAAGVPAARTRLVPDMAAAVAAARELARPPAVVLLSPAAPSYNAYRDFEQRGDDFAQRAAGG